MAMVKRKRRQILILVAIVFAVVAIVLSRTTNENSAFYWFVNGLFRDKSLILTTGYCNCGDCCGWELSRDGKNEPVYNYGALAGKKKKVGITSTGTRAKHGTIAADPKLFKMGTRLKVPGYGVGKVEDVGGAIKGRHIDLWFSTHDEARRWGRRWLKVKVLP